MPSAVIDTQILLRAATKNTTLAGKIVRDYLPLYQFVYSIETRNEIEDILGRPKTRRKFPHLTDKSVKVFLRLFEMSQPVALDYPIPKIVRDSKDDIF